MKKLEKYWEWKFNTDKFIKDYPENKRILEDKKEALAELTEVKTPNFDSPPGTPGRNDCVPASAERAEKLRREIKDFQNMVNIYEEAEKTFTAEERIVIKHLYHTPNSHMRTVTWLANQVIHCDRSTIYRISRKAKEKVKKYIGV